MLRDPAFRLFWLSNLSFYLNRWIEVVVLGWLILELTDSPLLVALTGALRWFPMLAFGMFTGVIADRVNRRTLVLVDQAGCMAVSTAVAVLMLAGVIVPLHIFLAALAIGLFSANDMPARRGLLADIAGEERLVSALTLDVVSLNLSVMLGGAMGGALLAWFGPSGAYVAIVGIYGVGLIAQFLAHPPRSQVKPRVESPLASLKAGARYAAGSRVLLATLLITVGTNLLGFPYKQLLPVFARDELRVGPEGLGMLAAADGVGALIATLGIAAMRQVRWKGLLYLGGALLMGFALVLFSFSHEFLISLPLLALLGMGMAGFQTMQSGIMLLASPPEMRGRMIGILSVAIGCFPLGIMGLGVLASLIGPLESVRIMGVLQLLLVSGVVVLAPQLRRF